MKLTCILFSLLFLHSCFETETVEVNLGDKPIVLGSFLGSVLMNTNAFTNAASADFSLNCGLASQFAFSDQKPELDSSEWQSCSSGIFSYSFPLNQGQLYSLNLWLRSGSVVSLLDHFDIRRDSSIFIQSPDLAANNEFGDEPIIALKGGGFIVPDPNNSLFGANAGALHFYSKLGVLRKTIYGQNPADFFGDFSSGVSGFIKQLKNGNIIFSAPQFTSQNGSINNGGGIFLLDSNGSEIARFEGATTGDLFGYHYPEIDPGAILELSNGNIVVASFAETIEGNSFAGSLRYINGETGDLISHYKGTQAFEFLGDHQLLQGLENGNFVFSSPSSGTGYISIINGVDGSEITRFSGDSAGDKLGYRLIRLENGNILVASLYENVNGVTRAGTVRVINAQTSTISDPVAGDDNDDRFGEYPVTPFSNGNFAFINGQDDIGAVTDAGSAIFVNGSTGEEISRFNGDVEDDFEDANIYELENGNFVISLPKDDIGAVVDGGTVILVNGSTGQEISRVSGETSGDLLGSNGITPLAGGHYIIASEEDDVGGNVDVGSAILIHGQSGNTLETFQGTLADDYLNMYVQALKNGNFILGLSANDVLGNADAGSVLYVNGLTGTVISRLDGDNAYDLFNGPAYELPSGNFVLDFFSDTIGTDTDIGSVRLINAADGSQINQLSGQVAGEKFGEYGVETLLNGDFLVLAVLDTVGAATSAGSVVYVDGTTGSEVSRVSGDNNNDRIGLSGVTVLENSYIIRSRSDDVFGVTDAGSIIFVPID